MKYSIIFTGDFKRQFKELKKIDLFFNKKSDIFQAIFGARNGRCSKNPRILA